MQDDLDRENEGDFIGAASTATAASVALMLRHCTGVVCAPLTPECARNFALPLMVPNNEDPFRTAFTVSVDLRGGTTTGISATDRAATIRALSEAGRTPKDFSRPGHVFPLLARSGGVLERAGHTEAGVDLCRLAGLSPVAYQCEVCDHETFEMTRLPGLMELARQLSLPLISVADLQRFRLLREVLVEPVAFSPSTPTLATLSDEVACDWGSTAHSVHTSPLSSEGEGGCITRSNGCGAGTLHAAPATASAAAAAAAAAAVLVNAPSDEPDATSTTYEFRSVFGWNRYRVTYCYAQVQQGQSHSVLPVSSSTADGHLSDTVPVVRVSTGGQQQQQQHQQRLSGRAATHPPGRPEIHIHVEGDYSANTQQHLSEVPPPLLEHAAKAQSGTAPAAADADFSVHLHHHSPPSMYSHLFPLPPCLRDGDGGAALRASELGAATVVCDRVAAELAQVIGAVVRAPRLPSAPAAAGALPLVSPCLRARPVDATALSNGSSCSESFSSRVAALPAGTESTESLVASAAQGWPRISLVLPDTLRLVAAQAGSTKTAAELLTLLPRVWEFGVNVVDVLPTT